MSTETFRQARSRIQAGLVAKGWTPSPKNHYGEELKTPWMTSQSGLIRLWFRPQAIWFTHSPTGHHEFANARSLNIEVRNFPVDAIIARVESFCVASQHGESL